MWWTESEAGEAGRGARWPRWDPVLVPSREVTGGAGIWKGPERMREGRPVLGKGVPVGETRVEGEEGVGLGGCCVGQTR